MAARHFQLPLAVAAQRLSDVYGDGAGVVNAAHDIPYRQVLFYTPGTPAGKASYIGSTPETSASDYGFEVFWSVRAAQMLGHFDEGPMKLSNYYAAAAVGVDVTLHILAIPF